MARIITVTSGKGGVGKTSISLNLSLSLASRGLKVCLFDADLGLANVSILTGLYPEYNLESVISGDCGIQDILIRDYQGIDIIPGSSGVERLADLDASQAASLINAFVLLNDYDYMIFDTSAGISSQVMAFCRASHEVILVATTEPTSLTDAYSLLKVLSKKRYSNPVKVVLNQIKSGKMAQLAYSKLKKTVDQFLAVKLEPLGIVMMDNNVRKAVIAQTPFIKMFPNTKVSRCINSIAGKLAHKTRTGPGLSMDVFWKTCLDFLDGRDKTVGPPERTGQPGPALQRIEGQLTIVTRELMALRQLFNTHLVSGKEINDLGSGSTPLDFTAYRNRQLPLSGNDTPSPAPPSGGPVARGRVRNPTQEELANWNEFENPVIKVAPSAQPG